MLENYDRQGRRITREEWGELWHEDYRRVGEWHGEGGISVSTVWLGIDHGFGGELEIFETMIFGPDPYPYNQVLTRYRTEDEAREGHDRTVDDLEHGRRPWFLVDDD